MNTLEMGANRTTGNEQQSAPEAFSQPCLYCLKDIVCLLLLEYLHTLTEKTSFTGLSAFIPFHFITWAEYRTLPLWCGCHGHLGSLRIWLEALQRLFLNVALNLFRSPVFISSETFSFFMTKSVECQENNNNLAKKKSLSFLLTFLKIKINFLSLYISRA